MTLASFYNSTTDVCNNLLQKFEHTDISHSCKQFAQATLPYLYEIDSNHKNILLTIGQEGSTNHRIRRGFGKTFGRLANVLYGISSNLDMKFIFDKITEINNSTLTFYNKDFE